MTEDTSIGDISERVVECLKEAPDGITAREISEENGFLVQKVYDVLSILNSFPNEATPLATKNGQKFILRKLCMDRIDKKIVAELQQARILIKKLKIVLECTDPHKKGDLAKLLEYVEVELPQNYVF